jgi:hypothetical protein
VRHSLAADDLVILPQKRFFVKHFFEKLLNFSELKSFSSFSVLTGTFERSLVLFKGFLLRLSEVILLSQRLALTYSTIPQPLLQAFFTFFSPFFALCIHHPVFCSV